MQKFNAEAHERRITWPLRVEAVTGSTPELFFLFLLKEEVDDGEARTRFVHEMSIFVASLESDKQQ